MILPATEDHLRVRPRDPALQAIAEKVEAGERITRDEAIALFETPDIPGAIYAQVPPEQLDEVCSWLDNPRIEPEPLDVTNRDEAKVVMEDMDVAISALPYQFNLGLTEDAIEVGTHLVDLVQWELYPDVTLERSDVEIQSARRWTTDMTPAQFSKVTGLEQWPGYLEGDVEDGLAIGLVPAGEDPPGICRLALGGSDHVIDTVGVLVEQREDDEPTWPQGRVALRQVVVLHPACGAPHRRGVEQDQHK